MMVFTDIQGDLDCNLGGQHENRAAEGPRPDHAPERQQLDHAPEGQQLNSSGWNPENRPAQALDPERVAQKHPSLFGPVRAGKTRFAGSVGCTHGYSDGIPSG